MCYQPGPVRSGRPQRASQLPACFLQTVGLPLPCQRRQLHPRGMRRPRPLTPSLSPLFVKAETESPPHSPSPPYPTPEIPPPADPQTQYGLTSVIVPAKLRATVLSVCRAIHCPRAFSSFLRRPPRMIIAPPRRAPPRSAAEASIPGYTHSCAYRHRANKPAS